MVHGKLVHQIFTDAKKRPPNVGKKVHGVNTVKGVRDKRTGVDLL